MKTFKELFGEAHSYGMEPPIGDYIKGLNAADERHAKAAKELKKRYKDMKGSFGKKETSKYGTVEQHGEGEYSGYHLRHHKSRGWGDQDSISLHHEGSDTLSKITKTSKGHRVNHRIEGSSSMSQVGTYHPTLKGALHYAIAHHKDKLFNSY